MRLPCPRILLDVTVAAGEILVIEIIGTKGGTMAEVGAMAMENEAITLGIETLVKVESPVA